MRRIFENRAKYLFEWFWRFLPDKCEGAGCSRKGVRGKEQVLYGITMCNDCYAKILNDESWPKNRIP